MSTGKIYMIPTTLGDSSIESVIPKDVQKIKLYFQDTFEIVDFDESSGDNKGTVICVVNCLKNKNRTFRVKPKGTREQKREWFNKGKSILVKN